MFKLAIDAGHYKYTAGKRCLKSIDPKETREWILNSRIAEKLETILSDYENIQILRVDDRTGEKDTSLSKRVKLANDWNADFYLSIHHNAGIKGGSGGGIVAYVYTKADAFTKEWQKILYNKSIEYTGLKGNRANPLANASFYVCANTKMPAVLMEMGFMDSTVDTPIILTEDYANKAAQGLAQAIIEQAELKKKVKPEVKPTPESKISVTYQVWDDVKDKWLPNVKDTEDYAGYFGRDVCAVYANLSKGNITYAVHDKKKKRWLPAVINRSDYAGVFNRPIDGLMMKTDTGKTIHYRVHLRKQKRWLPYVTGYKSTDSNNGYAGIIGQEIDAIQIYID